MAGKGQDNGRGHCLLSAAKLTAIVHCACWGRYLPQKKGCRLSISSPFSHFFNTLSDRLVISDPALGEIKSINPRTGFAPIVTDVPPLRLSVRCRRHPAAPLPGTPIYLFSLAFRLANPYIRRGSLRNASIKSGLVTRPIRHAFLMIWMTCGRS